MTTASKRASVAAWHARRAATGSRKVTVWLSPEAREKLTELAKTAGSKDRAAERAIMEAAVDIGDGLVRYPSGVIGRKINAEAKT
jgi:hypothetical protein